MGVTFNLNVNKFYQIFIILVPSRCNGCIHLQSVQPANKYCFLQYLHCDKSVIHHDFFCQEISTYCGFVLVAELLIHILVHQ